MLGRLDEALRELLVGSLPGLFGGDPAPVRFAVVDEVLTLDPQSATAEAGEPRVDDQRDNFPFDPAAPAGPYTLTRPPLPGPRRHRLTTAFGDRVPLHDDEIVPQPDDSRVFRVQPRPDRELAGFTGIEVLYGVTAVFVRLKGSLTFKAQLQSDDAARLEQAEALALAAIALNRRALVDGSLQTFADADYSAAIALEALTVQQTSAPAATQRLLHYAAEVTVRAARALRADEGRPIERIRTPGQPVDPARRVDIRIGVDA